MIRRNGSHGIESVDIFAHANPALVAMLLRWFCEGYGEQLRKNVNDGNPGALVPWALVATALVGTRRTRRALPRRSNAHLANLFYANPTWRASLMDGIDGWSRPFWRGVGYGVAHGVIRLDDGRLYASGKVKAPSKTWPREICARARTLGKVFAKEADASVAAVVFGLHPINGSIK